MLSNASLSRFTFTLHSKGIPVARCLQSKRRENGIGRHDGALPDSVGGHVMFSWALVFLVIALVAALLGLSGIAGTATNIAWLLFLVGLVMAVVFFVRGRSTRVV
jgi:uncharacterized membrane protein YtjA (UPF0391 family)